MLILITMPFAALALAIMVVAIMRSIRRVQDFRSAPGSMATRGIERRTPASSAELERGIIDANQMLKHAKIALRSFTFKPAQHIDIVFIQ